MQHIVIADTHVHLYPCYDIAKALTSAFANLGRIEQAAHSLGKNRTDGIVRILFLSERADCNVYSALREVNCVVSGYQISAREEGGLSVRSPQGEELLLIPGSQIVTAERLEVLALCMEQRIEDGKPIEQVLQLVREKGGVPVLPWSPGKWFFKRGQIVSGIIQRSSPGEILLADSTLRPLLYPEPLLLQRAQRKGIAVIAGTDPLPFPGEEERIGSYVTVWRADIDMDRPFSSLRQILCGQRTACELYGTRRTPVGVFRSLRKLKRIVSN